LAARHVVAKLAWKPARTEQDRRVSASRLKIASVELCAQRGAEKTDWGL
jgi:hypothetical protein